MDRSGLKYVNQTLLFAKIGLGVWTLVILAFGVLRIATGAPPFDPGFAKFAVAGWMVSALLWVLSQFIRSLFGDRP